MRTRATRAGRSRIGRWAAAVTTVALATTALTGIAPASAALPAGWSTLCTSIGGSTAPLVAGINCRLVSHGGLTRRYVVYVPAAVAASATPAPLVFMFHGSSGSGEQFLKISGWREVADAEGVIAVFPTGMKYRVLDTGRMSTKWHDTSLRCDVAASRPSGWPATSPYPADDVSFTDAMVLDVAAHESIDLDRIHASGFSNGSAFAQTLALRRADLLASVGSWAGQARECVGTDGNVVEPITPPARAIPVALGIGNRDDRYLEGINAWLTAHGTPTITEMPLDLAFVNGGFGQAMLGPSIQHLGLVWEPGAAIGVDDWAGVAWLPSWPAPSYVTARWSNPSGVNDAASFTFMLLGGVTHRYPNATPGKATLIKQSGSVHAATLFWKFFQRNPR